MVLWKGTTSVVPSKAPKHAGFSPCQKSPFTASTHCAMASQYRHPERGRGPSTVILSEAGIAQSAILAKSKDPVPAWDKNGPCREFSQCSSGEVRQVPHDPNRAGVRVKDAGFSPCRCATIPLFWRASFPPQAGGRPAQSTLVPALAPRIESRSEMRSAAAPAPRPPLRPPAA